jgi:hypothetical protein
MNALAEVFGEYMINQGLWPACSPILNPCLFSSEDTLTDEAYINNPHSSQETKENIWWEICYLKATFLCV